MISNVYNYYLSQYGNNKTNSKYDTHKKSELRNVYNNIMQANSKSPFYKVDLSANAQKFAIDVKESALALSNILSELSDEDNKTSFKKMAYSSEPDILEAEFIGKNNNSYSDVTIEIDRLASPQINTGTYLNPKQKDLEPGRYSFDVDISNVTYEFQYAVSSTDTNIDVQNKLVRLINNSNIGLAAGLSTDSLGNHALTIASTATGTIDNSPVIFTINDDATQYSGSVSALGLDSITQFAQDALLRINGEERTASSNEFTISRAYSVKLKSVTDIGQPVKLGLKADTDSMIDNIRNIVSGYNSIISLSSNAQAPVTSSQKLYRDFASVAKAYKNVLSSNGLNVTEDGRIDINHDMLNTISKTGNLNGTLEELKSFNDTLQSKVESAVLDPMTYANKVLVAYKNPNVTLGSPYQTSAYVGMMFNGYI